MFSVLTRLKKFSVLDCWGEININETGFDQIQIVGTKIWIGSIQCWKVWIKLEKLLPLWPFEKKIEQEISGWSVAPRE